jgi:DHA3 family macrolide efflux protein-like MFS transporter
MRTKVIPRELQTFAVVWVGQMISVIGSGLTSFALGLWVYQRTGSVTQFALIAFSASIPMILVAPFAGVLVDRYDRRWMMILGDTGAGLSTLFIAMLFFSNRLEIWHIYIATMINNTFTTLQVPAYLSAITLLVPKEQYGRIAGMIKLAQSVAEILVPTLAGVLMVTLKIGGIMVIDFGTFLVAVGTLLVVRFPRPPKTERQQPEQWKFLKEMAYGWTYIRTRPGLLGLIVFLTITTFLWSMIGTLIIPMILEFTTEAVLGVMISVAGFGLLGGSLVMSTWGGPKRRMNGVLGFSALGGLFLMLIGLRPSVVLVSIGAIGAHFSLPIFDASDQAIWQSKVAPDVQGRVFAIRQAIIRSATPLAYLSAGPLADRVIGPLLLDGGALSGTVGQVLGVGPGRGIGLMFIMMGTLVVATAGWGYLQPRIRLVEDELPDAVETEGMWMDQKK